MLESAGREQAGGAVLSGAGKKLETLRLETSTHLHVHKLSLTVSPICAPASNLLFLHRE